MKKLLVLVWLLGLAACGGSKPLPPDELTVARHRYAVSEQKRAEAQERANAAQIAADARDSQKTGLAGALHNASGVWARAAQTALTEAKATREEACRLDPSTCLEPVTTAAPQPVYAVAAEAPPVPESVSFQVNDFSVGGIHRDDSSPDWSAQVELDCSLTVTTPAGPVTITASEVSLPLCVQVFATAKWLPCDRFEYREGRVIPE